MKIEDLRTKVPGELEDQVVKMHRELMNLRFQRVNGQLASPAQFRNIRRDIARIKTVLREKASENQRPQKAKE